MTRNRRILKLIRSRTCHVHRHQIREASLVGCANVWTLERSADSTIYSTYHSPISRSPAPKDTCSTVYILYTSLTVPCSTQLWQSVLPTQGAQNQSHFFTSHKAIRKPQVVRKPDYLLIERCANHPTLSGHFIKASNLSCLQAIWMDATDRSYSTLLTFGAHSVLLLPPVHLFLCR